MNNLLLKQHETLSKFRIISLYFATALVIFSLLGIFSKGLNLGLDFTGGYLTEFTTEESLTQQNMEALLSSYLPDSFSLKSAENGRHWSVQQADNELSLKGKVWLSDFSEQSALTIIPLDSIYIGSQVGDELINQGGLALITSVIMILLYLSFRFEWRLAAGSVIALCHDVIIVLGIFAWFDIPFDLTIVASLLAIIGYSLNDSIIVGDKIREMMKRNNQQSVESMVNLAIKATIVRTLITSGTTLATILAVWIFAGESLAGFAMALFSGVLVGTFSSIIISATVPQLLGLSVEHYNPAEQELCSLP
ncbi:protein translocase subunit SecF [Cognaticolwellia aestuarii]|uniref:protein translocase subunit SecF n=1 Tax=Cognaticolwellia aestuarii TaxID=329993 RepID=UPI0009849277|nr:protein translocase subunit SecF [Cognaticolwellia aestuarii]